MPAKINSLMPAMSIRMSTPAMSLRILLSLMAVAQVVTAMKMGGPGSPNLARLRGVAKNTTTAAATAPEAADPTIEVSDVALQELSEDPSHPADHQLADVAQPVTVGSQNLGDDPEDGVMLTDKDGQGPKEYTAKEAISMIDQASQGLQGLDPSNTKQAYAEARSLIEDAKVDLIKAATTEEDSLKKDKYSDSYLEAQAARKEEERLNMGPGSEVVAQAMKMDPGAKNPTRLRGGSNHTTAAAIQIGATNRPATAAVGVALAVPEVDLDLEQAVLEDFSKDFISSHPSDQLADGVEQPVTPDDDQSTEEDDDPEDGNMLMDQDGQGPRDYTAAAAMSMVEQASQALQGLGTTYPSKMKQAYEEAHDLIKDAKHDLIKAAVTDKDSLKTSKYSDAYLEAQAARQKAERVASAGMVFGM